MADKSHEKIAQEIVALNQIFKEPFEWYSCFFETMRREWDLLDSVRVDKFMYLVRVFLKDSLKAARANKELWNSLLENLFEKCKIKGMALLFHIADVYVDEIGRAKMAEKFELIDPFVNLMKTTRLVQICDLIYNKVLLKLAENREKSLGEWTFTQATSQ
jgi:ribosomal RNA-processing protein 1